MYGSSSSACEGGTPARRTSTLYSARGPKPKIAESLEVLLKKLETGEVGA